MIIFRNYVWFLGAFTKLRKANINFIISVHRQHGKIGCHWSDFYEI